MAIDTNDLGPQGVNREGAANEEQKIIEGGDNKSTPLAEKKQESGSERRLQSNSFAEVKFTSGHTLQIKSRKGLSMAVKR